MHSALHLALFTFCISLPVVVVRTETVIGAESTGRYWGATFFPDGRAATVKFPLYPGFSRQTGSVSYDAHSGQAIFEHYNPHSISYGPVCADTPGVVPKFLFNITDAILEIPELGIAMSGIAKGFAMHKSRIYFLHYGSYAGDESMVHKFQIRALKSCEECGIDPYEQGQHGSLALLYTVKCSDVVAELPAIEQDYEQIDEFHLGNVLKIVGKEGSEKLDFYFQVGRLRSSDTGSTTELSLYHVTSDGVTNIIHEQAVDNRYASWQLKVIGAVDYLDGLLCWTTPDRVMCRYDDETHTVVAPAEALTKGICKGTVAEHLTEISGVSIVQASGARVVVFGCSPQTPDVTGSGIIRISAAGEVTVEAFMAESERLSAASLVNVKTLPESCSFEPTPLTCVPLERTTTVTIPTTIPTTTTTEPEIEEPQTKNPDTAEPETKEEPTAENEPSGQPEPGDNVVGDGEKTEPVSGSDDNGSNSVLTKNQILLHLLAVISVCLLLS